jgi:hypothetical protein
MVLMNAVCNKVLRPIDGSCCQALPAPSLLQKLTACVFLGSTLVFLVLHALGHNRYTLPCGSWVLFPLGPHILKYIHLDYFVLFRSRALNENISLVLPTETMLGEPHEM